jgi:hypothetical protein
MSATRPNFIQTFFGDISKWVILTPALLLLVALLLRLNNLNYNSPFNDEAIYIVVGRLGIFQWDWWSYNAAAWMAGYPYVYPSLSALAYMTGGVLGSRLLSVIFGVLSIELVFYLGLILSQQTQKAKYVGALIAALIVGFSSVSLYLSRLATYDIPSFYFLLLGVVLLFHAQKEGVDHGRWFFLSALSLIFAFFCKLIVGIYIPLLIVYSYYTLHNRDQAFYHWKRYFLIPIILALSVYFIGNFLLLLNYRNIVTAKDAISLGEMISKLWEFSSYSWLLWAIGSVGMLLKKEWKLWLILTFSGLLMVVPHLLTLKGEYTMEKHVFLLVVTNGLVAGLGISNLIFLYQNRVWRKFLGIITATTLLIFCVFSYVQADRYNHSWENAEGMLNYLSQNVKTGDKVLVEVGAAGILATYNNNLPTNTTTFDWFEYRGLQGQNAYLTAVREKYFDYIQLEDYRDSVHADLRKLIKENLIDNYQLVYSENNFNVYRRV